MDEDYTITTDTELLMAELNCTNITIGNDTQAVIEFGGDQVEYSGELPVSDAAKIFFECFKEYWDGHFKQEYKRGFKEGKKSYISEKEVQRGLLDGNN